MNPKAERLILKYLSRSFKFFAQEVGLFSPDEVIADLDMLHKRIIRLLLDTKNNLGLF